MPALPPAHIQEKYTGRSGRGAFEQAVQAFSFFMASAERMGYRHSRENYLLDLGCGWGRISQTALRHFPADHVYSLDVTEESMEICRSTGLPTQLIYVPDMRPPSALPPESVDLAVAFSVFSHLSEAAHWVWLRELHRVLKPGAVMCVTTRTRRHIDLFEAIRRQGGANSFWQDTEAAKAAYDAGDFVFDAPPAAGQIGADYGEAAIPEQYAVTRWKELFDDVAYFGEDESGCGQAVIVARK